MGITPLDIKKKTFSTQMRGLSKTEVREFLDLVASELEDLRKERALLAERADELAARVDAYEKTEKLLQDTLLTAQKATGELREDAKKEAGLVIEKARLEAERIRLAASQRVKDLADELRALELKRSNLVDEITGVARAYLAMAERVGQRKAGEERTDSPKRTSDT
jgi:cell division initiation protein